MLDDLTFAPEDDQVEVETGSPWKILIVDDDLDVHAMTMLTLKDLKVHGRRLSFVSAYSGQEAIGQMVSDPDVDLLLLDMVMESHDAGLRVASWLRDEMGRHDTPVVILRTGHPGLLSSEELHHHRHFNAVIEKALVSHQGLIDVLDKLLP